VSEDQTLQPGPRHLGGPGAPPVSAAPVSAPPVDATAPTVVIDFGNATAPEQPTGQGTAMPVPAYPGIAAPAPESAPSTDPLPMDPVPTAMTSSPPELVTCPECGASQQVQLNRRAASDFCSQCDFPLFWTPSRVERERAAASNGESLRRLPGTVGRSTLASAPCPHCAELNVVSAAVCIRCGQSMHPVEAPPPPPPPPAPLPPPPVIEVVPERGIPWWVWALLGVGIAALITLVVLILTGTIG
jgi:hypothetical protein